MRKLKSLRLGLDLTQKEVAERLVISRERYNQYETGRRNPDYEMLIKLADLFNVTTDYLLGRTNNPRESLIPPEYGQILITKASNANVSIEDLEAYIEALEKHRKKKG